MNRFTLPRDIYWGEGAIEELRKLDGKRAVLVLGGGSMRRFGFVDKVLAYLKEAGIETEFIENIEPDPSVQTVLKGAAKMREFEPDWIIAMGGGSPIDAAKAMWVFYEYPDTDFESLIQPFSFPTLRKKARFLAIPSTSGTGTEVTAFSVITDTEKGTKYPLADFNITPDIALVDPALAETMPPKLTAHTGMDALTHAIEAYTCMAANPLSDAYATGAIKKISQNLFKVLDNPKDAEARLELAQASTMAGIAFSNSMVGLVHSLGHALGAVAHLPHGLCMNLFLPYVLEYNKSVNGDKIAELLLPLAGADIYAQTPADQRTDKTIETLYSIRDHLYELTQLPRNLRETGKVSESQLDEVAEKALNDGSIIYNPKEASLTQLREILQKAW